MSILNPEHLLEQAERLMKAPPAGAPRQVDLRRAISSAYYAVFHFVLSKTADEFVGVTQRATPRYALIYRGVSHTLLRILCLDISKSQPPQKYIAYIPAGGFASDVQAFAAAAVELQVLRHGADYDPQPRFRTADAELAVRTARQAMRRFDAAPENHRKAFLTLLLSPPRSA